MLAEKSMAPLRFHQGKMSIANYLTFIRIFLSPFFAVFYLYRDSMSISLTVLPYILLFILIIIEFTDLFDGFVARKKNQVTDVGKVLDPMADSVTRLSIFFTFTQEPVNVPILLVLVFLFRDYSLSTLRIICALKGYALAARPSGKLKAVIQAIVAFSIILCMIPYSLGMMSGKELEWIATSFVGAAAIYTALSAIDYFIANRKYLKKVFYSSS